MGRTTAIAAVAVFAIAVAAPALLPQGARVGAQGGCSCFARVDAIDSDLRFVDKYYTATVLPAGSGDCAQACDRWRRDWFYGQACDRPTRINRGTNAWWGYEHQRADVFIGPDTWWCPYPPP